MKCKRVLSLMVILAITLSLVTLTASASSTEGGDANILSEAPYGNIAVDMEVPDVASISTVPSAYPIFSFSTYGTITTEEKHTGTKSLKLTGPVNWAVILTQGAYCNTNAYVFSAWIKTVNATGDISLIAANNTTGTNFATPISIAVGSNEWTKYSISFIVPAGTNGLIKFGLQGVSGGSVYMDGIELSQPTVTNSVVTDPMSCDSGPSTNLMRMFGIDTTMETSVQNTFAFNSYDGGYTNQYSHHGYRSLMLSGNNYLMTFLPTDVGFYAAFGKTYQFSAWIKTVGDAGTIKLLAADAVLNTTLGYKDVVSTSSEWTKYSFKFTVPAASATFTSSSIMKIGLEALSNTGKIYVDCIDFIETTLDTMPVVTGVADGDVKYFKDGSLKISFDSGAATLNSQPFASGSTVEATGNYSLVVTNGDLSKHINFTFIKPGDVNGDGNINSLDSIKVKNHLLNITPLSGVYKTAGDFTSKGYIDISDLLTLKDYIMGIYSDPNPFSTVLNTSSKVGYPFFTDKNDDFIQSVNKMWSIYGAVNDGTYAVYKFGNEPSYYEWMALKVLWSNESSYKSDLKNRILNCAISSDGYIWSWGDNARWPSGNALHFDNIPKYISSVYRVLAWENSTSFLDQVDTTTAGTGDVSNGLTVRQKINMAMNYMLVNMNGNNGLMIINNGENTGLSGSFASNYWDNFLFGYKDGYSNIYFYNSLKAMAQIEKMSGNTTASNNYEQKALNVKTTYNNTFFNVNKGRYIGSVDIFGGTHDYGFTFLNTEALAYGLGDTTKATDIYSWLDGTRTIAGDTSTGADIYNAFKIAPRSTTVAATSDWWNSLGGAIDVNTNAKFGEHLENGGAILYTSFYDMMARSKYLGADNAKQRFDAIVQEFKIDELRRDPLNSVGAPWVIGAINEYPESGLVPTTFLYGFLGIDATAGALTIAPNLPTSMKYAGVKDINYGGAKYDITVAKSKIEVSSTSGKSVNLNLSNLYKNGKYTLTITDNATSQIVSTQTVTMDSNGTKAMTLDLTGAKTATLELK